MNDWGTNPDKNPRSKTQSFSAFLSYSHADASTARKLHSQLETYRLPAGIKIAEENRPSTNSNGKSTLGKIFRDKEDLPAAQDLSAAVTEALDSSKVLIVMCSPAAKASPWVAREIDYFKTRYPARPILAAIIEGEPETAFPDELRKDGAEPLAADLRKEGDGWKLGFLKIVAGIAGVPLDLLVQRDGQRQTRRVMVVTGIVTIIALAMGTMTMIAFQARDEAQFQRQEADGLVAYMIDELHDELKGVGRLDVMEGVNERALQYYANQGDLSYLSEDELQTWARTLHRAGTLAEDRGKLDEAILWFSEAHRTTEELLKRSPHDAERIFSHAQSAYYVGYIAWEKQSLKPALEHWQAYRDLAEELYEIEPGKPRSFLELGYAEGNLCTFYLGEDRNLPRAEQHCLQAIAFLEKGREAAPSNKALAKTLANRQGWLAKLYSRSDRHQDALNLRRQEYALVTDLLGKDPQNRDLLMRQAWAIAGEAEQLSLLDRDAQARTAITRAEALGRALLATEPGSIEFLSSQFRILVKATDISARAGDAGWRISADQAERVFDQIQALDENEARELQRNFQKLESIKRGKS